MGRDNITARSEDDSNSKTVELHFRRGVVWRYLIGIVGRKAAYGIQKAEGNVSIYTPNRLLKISTSMTGEYVIYPLPAMCWILHTCERPMVSSSSRTALRWSHRVRGIHRLRIRYKRLHPHKLRQNLNHSSPPRPGYQAQLFAYHARSGISSPRTGSGRDCRPASI